ncbi:MFS transporter [Clostridium polynesiense]|uniref:MFS transporter n=1 Tax=Clostridium polynesiense TaxID=1325933 RepID=UPI0006940669|nr:MFS transporter [Clostridium polynesiense]
MEENEIMVLSSEKRKKKSSLWNINFILLWQGQMVSSLGDTVYQIALGFWILAFTGSTALMGTLMAASMIPKLIVSPFAGVWVDRLNRKWIIVLTDALRGVIITFLGTAAIFGFIEIWMVFTAGIIMGLCGAFFNPAMGSVLPDIVPNDKIVKANSVYNMAVTGTNVVGTVSGGYLYTLLGAPILFLVNGISYIFSAFTEVFMKIPHINRETENGNFKEDFKEGIKFSWNLKGLRYIMILACGINFFSQIGFILLMPMFQGAGGLGEEKYGVIMGILTAGMLVGMAFLSIYNLKSDKKYFAFMLSSILCFGAALFVPFIRNFYGLSFIVFLIGVFNSILNTILFSTLQLVVPQNMRGKVLSILSTLTQGLTPLGMLIAGVMAEFIPIRAVIFFGFGCDFILALGFMFIKSFKKFISFDPELHSLEDVINENENIVCEA